MPPVHQEVIMKFVKYGTLALLCVIGLSGAAEAHHYHGGWGRGCGGGGYYGGFHRWHHHW